MRRRSSAAATAVLVGFLLFSEACVHVSVTDEPAVSKAEVVPEVAVGAPAGEWHDVAVTAVDIEPSVSPDGGISPDKMKLVTVVENKGNRREKNLTVRVRLSSAKDGETLVFSTAAVDGLVPGESAVLRFDTPSGLPLRPAYVLRTELDPVPGETNLANNARTYQLQVSVMSR